MAQNSFDELITNKRHSLFLLAKWKANKQKHSFD